MQTLESFPGMHPDLAALLDRLAVDPARIHTRFSDVQVMCATHQDAREIVLGGKWESMAEIFRTNPDHPDAKAFPWGAEIPLANLAGYVASKP